MATFDELDIVESSEEGDELIREVEEYDEEDEEGDFGEGEDEEEDGEDEDEGEEEEEEEDDFEFSDPEIDLDDHEDGDFDGSQEDDQGPQARRNRRCRFVITKQKPKTLKGKKWQTSPTSQTNPGQGEQHRRYSFRIRRKELRIPLLSAFRSHIARLRINAGLSSGSDSEQHSSQNQRATQGRKSKPHSQIPLSRKMRRNVCKLYRLTGSYFWARRDIDVGGWGLHRMDPDLLALILASGPETLLMHENHLDRLDLGKAIHRLANPPRVFQGLTGIGLLSSAHVVPGASLQASLHETVYMVDEVDSKVSILLATLQTLDISHNSLVTLPSALSRLEQLFSLNVSHNHLTRIAPGALWLPNLVALDLSHNNLVFFGDVIKAINRVSILSRYNTLNSMDIHHDDLIGSHHTAMDTSEQIPSMSLQKLNSLNLSHNQITDFSGVLMLPALQSLDISYNRFSIFGPRKELHFPGLHSLKLSHNQLTAFELPHDTESANMIQNLQVLDISHNVLSFLPLSFPFAVPKLRSLNLSHNHISYLPPAFAALSHTLADLDISHNHVSVQSIALARLQSFSLARNGLNTLPSAFAFFLPNLHTLDLSDNQISGLPQDLRSFSHIHTLNLSRNHLSNLPPSFAALARSLSSLDLSHNRLVNLPEFFSSLHAVQRLYLKNNLFATFPVPIWHMGKLRNLSLACNSLTELPEPPLAQSISTPTTSSTWPLIEHLDVSSNQLVEIPTELLMSLPSLLYVNLSGNKITVDLYAATSLSSLSNIQTILLSHNDGLPNLDLPTNLQVLDISHTLSSELPTNLANCSLLTSLSASSNALLSIPLWFSSLPYMREIDFSRNRISSLPPRVCHMWRHMKSLNLSDNLFSSLPSGLSMLTKVSELNLSGNQLTTLTPNDEPISLILDNVASLHLARNAFQCIPSSITCVPNILNIDLMANSIASISKDIYKLSALESINLSSNLLSTLPSTFGHLLTLKRLYLAANKFNRIPETISTLVNLEVLHMHDNQISILPSHWHHYSGLLELTLHNNHISWLPPAFSGLSSLQSLWISNNPVGYLNPLLSLENLTSLNSNSAEIGPIHFTLPKPYPIKQLLLSNNNISSIPPSISLLHALQVVDISKNLLTSLPIEMESLSQLEFLNCAGNNISSINFSFAAFRQLKILLLGDTENGNALTSIPLSITSCMALQILDCSYNKLSSLPEGISACLNLQELILERNHFSGLPNTLSLLNSLSSLRIRGNPMPHATQRVYESLTNKDRSRLNLSQLDSAIRLEHIQMALELVDVVTLDLSSNRLTELPSWISTLSNLKHLILDYNLLQVLPPWICSMKLQHISLKGISQMNPKLSSSYASIIPQKSINSMEKTLKILEVLRIVESPKDKIFQTYEEYACQQLHNLSQSYTINGEVYDASLTTIELACSSSASQFLSEDQMKNSVWRRWTNYANPRRYLREKYNRSNWWSDGITKGTSTFLESCYHELYPFIISPLAKYLTSIAAFTLYLLVLISVIMYSNQTSNTPTYEYSKALHRAFDPSRVQTTSDYWSYVENMFIPLAYSHQRHLPTNSSALWHGGNSFFRVQSAINQRQVRSWKKNCVYHYHLFHRPEHAPNSNSTPPVIQYCVPPYSPNTEEFATFGTNNTFEWAAHNPNFNSKIQGHSGTWYSSSGYIFHMGTTEDEAIARNQILKEENWIDEQTRAVFIEFIVSNQNLRVISQVLVFFEFNPSGLLYPNLRITTIPISCLSGGYSSTLSYYWLLTLFALSFVSHEISKYEVVRKKYWKQKWNYLDLGIIFLLWVLILNQSFIILLSPRIVVAPEEDGSILLNILDASFGTSVALHNIQREISGILVLLSFAKFFYYSRLQSVLGPLQICVWEVLSRSFRYFYVVAIFFAAFSVSLYAAFGDALAEFSSLPQSINSLTQLMFGVFDFEVIHEDGTVLGSLFFYVSLTTFGLLLINLLIAMMTGLYAEANHAAHQKHALLVASATLDMMNYPTPPPFNLFSGTWSLLKRKLFPLIDMEGADEHFNVTAFQFNRFKSPLSNDEDTTATATTTATTTATATCNMTADGLSLCLISARPTNIVGVYAWTRRDKFQYFEVEMIQPGRIYVGLVSKASDFQGVPGVNLESIAFSGFDQASVWSSSLCDMVGDSWNQAGTVIGCGVDFARNYIFFTRNGVPIPRKFGFFCEGDVYPMVHLGDAGACVRTNFGRTPFLANLKDLRMISSSSLGRSLSNQKREESRVFEAPQSTKVWASNTGGFLSYTADTSVRAVASDIVTVLAQEDWIKEKGTRSFAILVLHAGPSADITIGFCDRTFPRDQRLGSCDNSIGFTLSFDKKRIAMQTSLFGAITKAESSLDAIDVTSIRTIGLQLTEEVRGECEIQLLINDAELHDMRRSFSSLVIAHLHPAVTLVAKPQSVCMYSLASASTETPRNEAFTLPLSTERLRSSDSFGAAFASVSSAFVQPSFGIGASPLRRPFSARIETQSELDASFSSGDVRRSSSLLENQSNRTNLRHRRRIRSNQSSA